MSDFQGVKRPDAWTLTLSDILWRFARDLRALHQTNPKIEERLLPQAMARLALELKDAGFSQADIRQAYQSAVAP